MNNNYSNGIISKPNITAGNPYGINRTFIARVANSNKFGTVQIPMLNQQQGLEMLSPDNLYETNNATNIEENSYYVDYAAQIIYFNPKQIGQKVVFIAYDMGEDLISDHKICTLIDNNGNPIETLKDIMEKGFESLDYLNTIGSAIEITDLLKAEIVNGKNTVDNLQEKIILGGNTITQLTNTTNEAKATNTTLTNTNDSAKNTDVNLKTTTSVANTKNEELRTTINNAEAKKVEVVTATTNANTSKTQLQTVLDDSVTKKTQLQTTIDDSVVKKAELQAVIGQADIGTMKTDILNNTKNITTNTNDISDIMRLIPNIFNSRCKIESHPNGTVLRFIDMVGGKDFIIGMTKTTSYGTNSGTAIKSNGDTVWWRNVAIGYPVVMNEVYQVIPLVKGNFCKATLTTGDTNTTAIIRIESDVSDSYTGNMNYVGCIVMGTANPSQ